MYSLKRTINIILDLIIHIIISLEVFSIVYFKTGEISYLIPVILGGILIDIDHLIDYIIQFEGLSFKKISVFPYKKRKNIYLFFHSWELVILGVSLSFFYNSLFWQVFFCSWGLHLLVDNIDGAKAKGFLHYFFTYRLVKKFKAEKLKGFIFD
jgi:thiamine transporter ThiT